MTARVAIVIGFLAVAAAVIVAGAPRAETPAQRVERIAAELRCPVCQGLSVADSSSDTARAMRALIEERVAQGRTDDEVRDEFRRAYGEWIILSPPLLDARGAVWVLPVVALIAGAVVAWLRLGRTPPVAGSPSPEQLRALREREIAEEAVE
ncbi:MAG: cytochrome c-type biogenesis protein CcmH [Chloroflexi bacterium]|nr:cytochrome c-type biogenesis protein CcmH [Chloroflexota bacterium]